jgi:hypothetical protein
MWKIKKLDYRKLELKRESQMTLLAFSLDN